MRSMAKTSTVTAGSITLGVAVGPRQYIAKKLLGKADVIRLVHERVQLCQDPQTEFALLRESMGEATTSCGYTATQSFRNSGLQRSMTRLGTALPGSHGGQYDASNAQRRPVQNWVQKSARHRGSGTSGCSHRSQNTHPGYDPRRGADPGDASLCIETATSTYLSALVSDEQATAKLYVQKAAQADVAWQQTIGRLQGRRVANPTIASLEHLGSAFKDEGSDDMDFSAHQKTRLGAPQLQAQLSRLTDRTRLRRLKNTLLSQGAWQQVTESKTCATRRSPTWLYTLGRVRGKCLDAARLHYPYAKKTRQLSLGGRRTVPMLRFLPGPTDGTLRNLQQRRSHAEHYACFRAVVSDMTLADPGITTEPWELTASQSKPADMVTTAAVPGRSAVLDVCVCGLLHCSDRRHSIVNFHITGMKSEQ